MNDDVPARGAATALPLTVRAPRRIDCPYRVAVGHADIHPFFRRCRLKKVLVGVALLAMALPCWSDEREEVSGLARKWADAWNAKDVDALASLYSSDALLWGTVARELASSPDQRRAYFTAAFKRGLKVSFGEGVLRVDGTSAVNCGAYSFALTPTAPLPARYCFTYFKRDGRWQIVAHHSSWLPEPPK